MNTEDALRYEIETLENSNYEALGTFYFLLGQWVDIDMKRKSGEYTAEQQIQIFSAFMSILGKPFMELMDMFPDMMTAVDRHSNNIHAKMLKHVQSISEGF